MDANFTLTPVCGKKFVGRRETLKEILGELTDRKSTVGFCLHGRRRVGKTSILRELECEISDKKGIVIAYLSLYDLGNLSLKTFTEQLSATVLEAFRKKGSLPLEYSISALMKSPREVVDSALSRIKLGAEISEELRFFLEFRGEKQADYTDAVRRAFSLGEKLAGASGSKFILILDEFPEILKVENGEQVVKMLRTIQERQKNTSLIISGSEKKTLETVALSSASPFYKQLVSKQVSPFSFEETLEFLKRYRMHVSKEGAEKLHQITGGVPFYLQYLGRSAGLSGSIDSAIDEFLREEGNIFFTEEFQKLTEKEKAVVRAIASGESSPTGIAEKSSEPVTSVSSYLVVLQEKEVVSKTDKATYALADQLFSKWLKRKYS